MSLGWYRPKSRIIGVSLSPEVQFILESSDGLVTVNLARSRDILANATHVHERIHWLHQIGTTSGVFFFCIQECQALCILTIVQELGGDINPTAFPLSSLRFQANGKGLSARAERFLAAWHGLEMTSRALFGGAHLTGTEEIGYEAIPLLANFLAIWLKESTLPTADWVTATPRVGPVAVQTVNGQLLGYLQITEALARFGDACVLQKGIQTEVQGASLDTEHLFQGVYGTARKEFYRVTRWSVSTATEAVFSVLLYESLNSPLPPFGHFSRLSASWRALNPYARFKDMTAAVSNMPIPDCSALSVKSYQEVAEAVKEHLSRTGLLFDIGELSRLRASLFDPFIKPVESGGFFTVEGGKSYPSDNLRYLYVGDLIARAFQLYESHPNFLQCPALYYLEDRKEFRKLAQSIQPLCWYQEGYGIRPTVEEPALHSVLMFDAYMSEVLHGAMTMPYQEFIKSIAHLVAHQEHARYTLDALRTALMSAQFGDTFVDTVMRDVTHVVDARTP